MKRTREEVLNSRAEAAWKYRQRHKQEVNEKARLLTCNWSIALELLNTDGITRTRKASALQQPAEPRKVAPPPPAKAKTSKTTKTTKVTHHVDSKEARKVVPAPVPAPRASNAAVKFNSRPNAAGIPSSKRPRACGSPSPKSLAAIAAGDSSDEESSSNDNSDADEPGWSGGKSFGSLSLAVQLTAEPGYVPQRGQQPIIREGVRYWY
ncbi:hypothetical protein C8F04DRAFT_1250859 [Mycena alexandri]|uniref:Uncharacterized protein n=1 Tax=Mycena alexandri TaxID=1745969 RepID=A0AAD6XCY9_9AGAR|nr:hypothetical protein C8F04DRAFT_1250859 [Mycena alexandri]